jgi:hypothetical protein
MMAPPAEIRHLGREVADILAGNQDWPRRVAALTTPVASVRLAVTPQARVSR